MRLLVLVFLLVFTVYSDVIHAGPDSKSSKNANLVSHNEMSKPHLVAESSDISSKKFLRVEDATTKSEEERDITAGLILKTYIQGAVTKSKRTTMLFRGFKPDKVAKKMKVVRVRGKNFNNFARYYARYRAKYPKKALTMPKSPQDAIVLPKLAEWSDQKLLPIQIKLKLGEMGVIDTTKYVRQYILQSEIEIIVPELNKWISQKLLPTQIGQKLAEIGVTDAKYVEWYTKAFDDALVLPTMKNWVKRKMFPQHAAQKLADIGLTDPRYVEAYVRLWGRRQAKLSKKANALKKLTTKAKKKN